MNFLKSNGRTLAVLVLVAVALSACVTDNRKKTAAATAVQKSGLRADYAAVAGERFPVPAVDTTRIDPKYLRQIVDYRTAEQPGTIIVDTSAKFLYLVREGGRAIRYGIGVGREGFSWAGRARVGWKRAWPTWTPPADMIAREPELEKYRNGMQPGLDNPLGARALYIFEGNRDTLYRVHGTNEPESIGKAVSSGCIRLLNQDIIDLYDRVPVDAKIVVLAPGGEKMAAFSDHRH